MLIEIMLVAAAATAVGVLITASHKETFDSRISRYKASISAIEGAIEKNVEDEFHKVLGAIHAAERKALVLLGTGHVKGDTADALNAAADHLGNASDAAHGMDVTPPVETNTPVFAAVIHPTTPIS